MDYSAMFKEAWRVTRSRPLLGMGAITVVSSAVIGLVVLVASTLASGLLVVVFALGATASDPVLQGETASAITAAANAVGAYTVPAVVVMIGLLACWIVLAIYDVAAQGALVAQADVVLSGGEASFSTGMRTGMARWWRVAGLLAIAALPALAIALGYSIVIMSMTSGLSAGTTEASFGPAFLALQLMRPVAVLVQLVTIPLSVLIVLAVRFAVIDGLEWRDALAAGWRLLKGSVISVLVVMGMLYALGLALGLVFAVVAGLAVAIAVMLFAAVVAAGDMRWAVAGGIGLLVVVSSVIVLIQWPVVVFSSTLWTVFWRCATGRDTRFLIAPGNGAAPAEPTRAHVPGVPDAHMTATEGLLS